MPTRIPIRPRARILLYVVLVIWPFFLFASTLVNLTSQVQGILPVANGGTGSSALATTLSNSISSAVTMTTAGTFYAGPTVSLTAGTWLLNASVDIQTTSTASAVQVTCKLWDGTNVAGAAYYVFPALSTAAARNAQLSMTGILTETGSKSGYVSCTANTASQLIEAAPGYTSPGNYASTITALQLN
ncbi:MAG: hypothetical protein ACLP1Y_07690 [Candidatus Acidiferrales bacterium]